MRSSEKLPNSSLAAIAQGKYFWEKNLSNQDFTYQLAMLCPYFEKSVLLTLELEQVCVCPKQFRASKTKTHLCTWLSITMWTTPMGWCQEKEQTELLWHKSCPSSLHSAKGRNAYTLQSSSLKEPEEKNHSSFQRPLCNSFQITPGAMLINRRARRWLSSPHW